MTYDEELARRIRERIGAERPLTESRMFGGLAFLIEGSMALAVSGQGGLMARVDAEDGIALSERDGVAPMIMNRRPMRGWLRVAPDVVADDASLDEWVTRCVDYVKGTGMPIREMRDFVELTRAGDDTVADRVAVLTRYREELRERMTADVERMEFLNRKITIYSDILAARQATPEDVTGATVGA